MAQTQGAVEVSASSLPSPAKDRTDRDFTTLDHVIPRASMKMLRENPTCTIIRFKAGAVEPAQHSTSAYDLVVIRGKSTLSNLSKGAIFNLRAGDWLQAPIRGMQRVKYHEDMKMFIKWDGQWDMLEYNLNLNHFLF